MPKLIVSTMAAGDTRPYVGDERHACYYSVVDIAGINRVSRRDPGQCRGAPMAGHGRSDDAPAELGGTSPAADRGDDVRRHHAVRDAARELLEAAGYEVLVFHATGTGGRAMEALIADGFIAGVLDITTTELADELVGGVLTRRPGSARRPRAAAACRRSSRSARSTWSTSARPRRCRRSSRAASSTSTTPTVTLMRTTPEENAELGERDRAAR